jgi:hypothetical protein
MKLDRHVDGESLHGSSGSRPSAPNPAQSTTFRKSVRLIMTRLLGLRDSGVYATEAAGRWYLRPASLSGDASSAVSTFASMASTSVERLYTYAIACSLASREVRRRARSHRQGCTGATPQVRAGKLHNFITLQLYNPELS